jgi:hypothetical protein
MTSRPKSSSAASAFVRRAAQRQVRRDVLATARKRLQVMQLEVPRLAVALALLVRERATRRVACEDLTSFSRRDVSTALAKGNQRVF